MQLSCINILRMKLGTRNTKIKNQILEIFETAKYPISASEIISKVKANKTTVYRELLIFSRDGILKEVEFGDGRKRYELSGRGHHHHLICSKCKKIDDVILDEKYLLKEVKEKSNFKIEDHSLEFFGICASCQ